MGNNCNNESMRSASNFLNKDIDKELEATNRVTKKPFMYAKSTPHKTLKNCYLCGTTDNVEFIEFGLNISSSTHVINLCSECKAWFGEYLLSGASEKIKKVELH